MQISANSIEFMPAVGSEFRPRVEALFFFNPRQQLLRDGIRQSVEQYGRPEILEGDGKVWLGIPLGGMQCLFAVNSEAVANRLAGVALYLRTAPDLLAISHLAVHPDYAAGGNWGGDGVGLLLIEKVRQVARRISGVNRLELPYRHRRFLSVYGSKLAEGIR